VNNILIFNLNVVFVFLFSTFTNAEQLNNYVLTLNIEKENSDFVYIIDDIAKSKKLLLELPCKERMEGNPSAKSLLKVHEDVSISLIMNTLGIMKKAGCRQPDIFYFDANKTYLVKINFDRSTPYK
jgi:DUF2075 family protein